MRSTLAPPEPLGVALLERRPRSPEDLAYRNVALQLPGVEAVVQLAHLINPDAVTRLSPLRVGQGSV